MKNRKPWSSWRDLKGLYDRTNLLSSAVSTTTRRQIESGVWRLDPRTREHAVVHSVKGRGEAISPGRQPG